MKQGRIPKSNNDHKWFLANSVVAHLIVGPSLNQLKWNQHLRPTQSQIVSSGPFNWSCTWLFPLLLASIAPLSILVASFHCYRSHRSLREFLLHSYFLLAFFSWRIAWFLAFQISFHLDLFPFDFLQVKQPGTSSSQWSQLDSIRPLGSFLLYFWRKSRPSPHGTC